MFALFTWENLIALATLTVLEIVLGIDNLVFLSILTGKLPPNERPRARFVGLGLALFARIGLLLGITWVMGLTQDFFQLFGHGLSGKDLILVGGGLFLIAKATHEIHEKTSPEHANDAKGEAKAPTRFIWTIAQIVVIDLVFSLDSVITAVGMARAIPVMITAVIIAVIVMMVFSGAISDFVDQNPAIKVLALAFLILVGVMLTAEGFDQHISRGYVYFAMAFSLVIELINMRSRRIEQSLRSLPPTGETGPSAPGG